MAKQNKGAQLEPRRAAHRSVRITRTIRENAKTVTIVLDASLQSEPGQFAMLWIPGVDEKPFSISGDDPLSFTVSNVGPFSAILHGLKQGDSVWYRGPFGRGFSASPGRTLLVGGGYGCAPLLFLARTILRRDSGSSVEAAVGGRTSADILFEERFNSLGLRTHIATEDGSMGARGLVTDVARALIDEKRFDLLCSCGPEGMLDSLASISAEAGLHAELSFEAYMRCGIGICGSCEHGGRLVCMDGPVRVFAGSGS